MLHTENQLPRLPLCALTVSVVVMGWWFEVGLTILSVAKVGWCSKHMLLGEAMQTQGVRIPIGESGNCCKVYSLSYQYL